MGIFHSFLDSFWCQRVSIKISSRNHQKNTFHVCRKLALYDKFKKKRTQMFSVFFLPKCLNEKTLSLDTSTTNESIPSFQYFLLLLLFFSFWEVLDLASCFSLKMLYSNCGLCLCQKVKYKKYVWRSTIVLDNYIILKFTLQILDFLHEKKLFHFNNLKCLLNNQLNFWKKKQNENYFILLLFRLHFYPQRALMKQNFLFNWTETKLITNFISVLFCRNSDRE